MNHAFRFHRFSFFATAIIHLQAIRVKRKIDSFLQFVLHMCIAIRKTFLLVGKLFIAFVIFSCIDNNQQHCVVTNSATNNNYLWELITEDEIKRTKMTTTKWRKPWMYMFWELRGGERWRRDNDNKRCEWYMLLKWFHPRKAWTRRYFLYAFVEYLSSDSKLHRNIRMCVCVCEMVSEEKLGKKKCLLFTFCMLDWK